MKDGFILYCSHYPTINKLSIVEKGKLLDAVFQYHIDNKEPKFDSISVEITFSFLKQQFDRDLEKYQNVVNRNKKNIEKRWDKTDTKNTNGIIGTIINTKNTDNEMGKDNDKVKGKNLNINAAIAATQKRINDFKVSLFPFVKDYKKELVKEFFLTDDSPASITSLLENYHPDKAILSSVINHDPATESLLSSRTTFHKLSHLTRLNFTSPVSKQETIGADRLALVAAAVHF